MSELLTLSKNGVDFLGTKYPIMGGAMSWISESGLVSAISNAGGFGVLACGSMTKEQLELEIQKTKQKTDKPFGVNLIIMHPDIIELIEVCLKNDVSHIVLAGGIPKSHVISLIKEITNTKIICFAPSLGIANKLIKLGADALIIEGMEAGGHIGPVSLSVLAQEILPFVTEVPVFVAGGIGSYDGVISYLRMGAAGCQIGTRFVCAKESIAHQSFKDIIIKSSARHAVSSVQISDSFPVIPVRAIANQATKDFMKVQQESINLYESGKLDKIAAQLKIEHYWAGALRKAVIDGDIERGSLMAGQSVGMVTKEQTTQEIIDELVGCD